MLNSFWQKLRNASDIRGTAIAIEPNEVIDLTNENIKKIALGFATWVLDYAQIYPENVTIAVGHDPRLSAMRIKSTIINALRTVGFKVYDCSLTTTPSMHLATTILSCTAAIQITASHLKYNYNGLKFFNKDGGLSEKDVENILQYAQDETFPELKPLGDIREIKLLDYYVDKLKKVIKKDIKIDKSNKLLYEKPLTGYKIVVDAGNGAGGFFVDKVIKELGADTKGSLYLKPDGNFPNHMPNPEDPIAIKSIKNATIESDADLGIIFDTDVDRVSIIDKNGNPITSSKLVALVSAMCLDGNNTGVIVTDSVTSYHLTDFIESIGGKQLRFKRGYHKVIGAAKKLTSAGVECPLAIETSGHACLKENNFIDDGAYLACKFISRMVNLRSEGKTLESLIENFKDCKEHIEIDIPLKDRSLLNNSIMANSHFETVYEELTEYSKTIKSCEIDVKNIEGIRLKFNLDKQNGWCIIRKSVHTPIMILYIESDVENGIREIIRVLNPFFKKMDVLDSSNIDKIFREMKLDTEQYKYSDYFSVTESDEPLKADDSPTTNKKYIESENSTKIATDDKIEKNNLETNIQPKIIPPHRANKNIPHDNEKGKNKTRKSKNRNKRHKKQKRR